MFRINALLMLQKQTDVLLEKILDEVVQNISFDRGIIRLLDETGRFLEAKVVKDYSEEDAQRVFGKPLNINGDDCIPVKVVKSGEVFVLEDAKTQAERLTLLDKTLMMDISDHGSIISAPLKNEDKVIGVITSWRQAKTSFFPEELALFLTFATQIGIVIENFRLLPKMPKKSENSFCCRKRFQI